MKEAVKRDLLTEAVAKEYDEKFKKYSKLNKCLNDYKVSHRQLCALAEGDEDASHNEKMKTFITEDIPDYVKDPK